MAKYITLKLTEAQFIALIDMADTLKAEIGTGHEFGVEQNKNIRLIDRMLNRNGYKRKHN